MKKIFVAIVLLLCSYPLFSKSIAFSGSGKTEKEALLDALQNLSSAVSSEVNYSSKYSVFDDGQTGSPTITTNLTSQGIKTNSFYLLGSVNTEEIDGTYTTTVTFSEEDTGKIQESAYALISIIDNMKKETVENYLECFEAWNRYEILSYIASELSISISAPSSDRAILKASFASFLKNEARSLKREFKNATTKEERRKEINDRLLILDEISQSYNLNIGFNDKMPDLDTLIGTIEEQKALICNLSNKKDSQIQYYISQSTTEINNIENEIKNRAWTSFDYDSTGNISQNSKNKREAERKDRVNEVINTLNEEVKTIENLYSTQIEPILETLSENYTALMRTPKYTSSTSSENVSLTIGQYDSDLENWPFTVTIKLSFAEVSFEGKIPFSSASRVLNNSIASNDYENKIKAINLIDATLKTLDNLSVEASYNVRPDAGASMYSINATLSFKHNEEDFFIYLEEKFFSAKTVVPIAWTSYGFASDCEEAIKISTEKMFSATENNEYTEITEETKTEQRGSLYIAKTSINTNSVSPLIDRINKNNDKLRLIRSSVTRANISNINSILTDSANIVSFLNSLGFFFNYKTLYDKSYISAIYASYCTENNLQDSLIEKAKNNLSSLELKEAETLIQSINYTPKTSTEFAPFIEEVEKIKEEIYIKKTMIPQALEEVRADVEAKESLESSEIADIYKNEQETKEKKTSEIKAYYEKLLPSALYKKETELLSSYNYKGSWQQIQSLLENMKNSQFSINSLTSSLVLLSWGETDLKTGQKYFTLSIKYNDKEYNITDKINVSSFFNNSTTDPSEMGINLYSSYVEYINALDYASLFDLFVAEIIYRIDSSGFNEDICEYRVGFSSMTIKRRDTGEVVYEHAFTTRDYISVLVDSVDFSIPEPTIARPEGYREGSKDIQTLEYFGDSFSPYMSVGISNLSKKFSSDMGVGFRLERNKIRLLAGVSINLSMDLSSMEKTTTSSGTTHAYDGDLGVYCSFDANALYRINKTTAYGLGIMRSISLTESSTSKTTSFFGVFDYNAEIVFFNAKIGASMAQKTSFFISVGIGFNLNDMKSTRRY